MTTDSEILRFGLLHGGRFMAWGEGENRQRNEV